MMSPVGAFLAALLPCSSSPPAHGPGQCPGTRAASRSPCRALTVTGLIASFVLTRYFVSRGQDVVSVHLYTCTMKRKLLLAHGQAGMRATFTHSHKRDICLTKVKLNPDPSAAWGTEKLRSSRPCGMCRGWNMGCAGLRYGLRRGWLYGC